MKTITLNILAEDFKTSCFTNSDDCVLTRAAKRLNITGFASGSRGFYKNNGYVKYPEELMDKVRSMYHSKPNYPYPSDSVISQEPQDFTYSLEVPDNW